jgi:hypothetical protein
MDLFGLKLDVKNPENMAMFGVKVAVMTAALDYLFDVNSEEKTILLKRTKLNVALKRGKSHFCGLHDFLTEFANCGECTNVNFEIIFGPFAKEIRPFLKNVFDIRMNPGSQTANIMRNMTAPDKDIRAKGYCSCCCVKETGEKDCRLKKCSHCEKVFYCSRDCQVANWILHRPDCYRSQGKVVTEKQQLQADEAKEVLEVEHSTHTKENPKENCPLCDRITPEDEKPYGLIALEKTFKDLLSDFRNPEKMKAMEKDYENHKAGQKKKESLN